MSGSSRGRPGHPEDCPGRPAGRPAGRPEGRPEGCPGHPAGHPPNIKGYLLYFHEKRNIYSLN